MTNKEKAIFIVENNYSTRSKTTLERLTADELDWIIQNKRDPEKDEFSINDTIATKELLLSILNFLDDFKKSRSKDEKGINPALKSFVMKNSDKLSNYTNAKIAGILGIFLFFIAMIAIFIDSIFGFDFLKKLLGIKITDEKTEQQQNQNHNS